MDDNPPFGFLPPPTGEPMMYGIGTRIYVPATRLFGTITEFTLIGPLKDTIVMTISLDDGTMTELYPSQVQPAVEARKDWYVVTND